MNMRLVVILLLAIAQSSGGRAAEQPPGWGEVLYEYFQGNHFEALTQLEIAAHRQQLDPSAAQPALLRGRLSMQFGLYSQAEAIFKQQLEHQDKPTLQAAVYIQLANLYEQLGDLEAARTALTNVAENQVAGLNAEQQDKYWYLVASLQIQGGTLIDIRRFPVNALSREYLNYNLAMMEADRGETQNAVARLQSMLKVRPNSEDAGFFSRVGDWVSGGWFSADEQQINTEEQASLKDRQWLTLGYLLQSLGRHQDAINAYQQVRQDSVDTQAAMLAWGWAAAERGEFQLALSIWQLLAQQPVYQHESYEAPLAVAYAYEKLNAPRQALTALNQASRQYSEWINRLQAERVQLYQSDFFQPYVQTWQQGQSTPEDVLSPVLMPLLTDDQFSQQVAQLADLQQADQRVLYALQQLTMFEQLIDERQQSAQQRGEALAHNNLLQTLPTLQQQRDGLQTQLDTVEHQQDALALLNDDGQALLQRIGKADTRLSAIEQQMPDADSYRARIRRLHGILLWQAEVDYASNLWAGKRNLQALDSLLASGQTRLGSIYQAMDRRAHFDAQRARITGLRSGLLLAQQTQQRLQDKLLARMQQAADVLLIETEQQLQRYRRQAQIAIVRLQDETLRKQQAIKPEGARDEG